MGPRINTTYEKQETEKRRSDGYHMFILGWARSPLRDFESYLRILIGLGEDDVFFVFYLEYNNNE